MVLRIVSHKIYIFTPWGVLQPDIIQIIAMNILCVRLYTRGIEVLLSRRQTSVIFFIITRNKDFSIFDESSTPKYDDVIIKGVWVYGKYVSLEVLFYHFSLSCY